MKTKRKKNPADLTGRNNDARKKEIRSLQRRVAQLESNMEFVVNAIKQMVVKKCERY